LVVLEKLEARNFRKLDLTIEFPKGMLIIKGPNEAGKSTILEAILYAFFGRMLRGTKDLAVNHRASVAKVKLIFSVDGRRYQVERIIRRGRESEARISEITPTGGLIRKAATVKRTNEFIQSLLGGLSLNEILVTNVVAQKELDKLIEMRGQEREKIINALLGLESYNKAIEKLSLERREKKRELEFKKRTLEEVKKRLENYKRDLEDLREKSLELKNKRKVYEEEVAKLQEKESLYRLLKEYRDALIKKRNLETKIEGMKSLLRALKESLSKLEEQLRAKEKEKINLKEELEREEVKLKEYKKKLSEYIDLESTQKAVGESKDKLARLNSLKERMKDIKAKISELESVIEELKSKVDEKRLNNLIEEDKELDQKISKTKISLPVLLALLSTSLLGLFIPILYATGLLLAVIYYLAISHLKSKLTSRSLLVKDEIRKYSGLLSLMREREKDLEKKRKELQIIENQAKGLEEELEEIKASIPEKYKPESWNTLYEFLEGVSKRVEEARGEKISIENKILSSEERIKNLKSRISRLSVEIYELEKLRAETIEKIKKKEEEVSVLEKEVNSISLPELPDRVSYSEELYRSVEAEYNLLTARVAALKGTIRQLELQIERLKERIKKNEGVEEEYEKLKKEIKELEKIVEAQEIAITSLRQVAKSIRERFQPAIENNMNHIISIITGGRYKAVRLDSNYNIEVLDSEAGKFVPKDIYSGGMVDQLLLAMRLAFILSLLPETKQTYPRFLFLDEPLSSSDSNRRKNIVDLLTKTLRDQFKQIILITHVDVDAEGAKVISIEEGKIKTN